MQILPYAGVGKMLKNVKFRIFIIIPCSERIRVYVLKFGEIRQKQKLYNVHTSKVFFFFKVSAGGEGIVYVRP